MSIQILQDILGLGQNLPKIGANIGADIQRRRGERQARQTGNLLQNVLGQIGGEGGPQDLQQALAQVLAQGGQPNLVQQFGTLGAALERSKPKSPLGEKSRDELVDLFKKFGMSDEIAGRNADLYSSLTVGGQTAFANQLMENIQRGSTNGLFDIKKSASIQTPSGQAKFQEDFSEQQTDPFNPRANVEPRAMNFPEVNPFEDLTPTEKVKRQGELFKENSKRYKELQESLKNSKTEALTERRLTQLNDSKKLPKGMGKAINIDWKSGKIRFPSFANKETQLYVKTLNQFIKNAKDYYGARVTNFELDSFMQMLPTLANTEEGRRLILDQMKIVREISQLYDDSEKEVLNYYGLYDIDPASVDQIASINRKGRLQALEKAYDEVVLAQDRYLAKQDTPQGSIAIEINGQRGYIPASQRDEAIRKGAKIL